MSKRTKTQQLNVRIDSDCVQRFNSKITMLGRKRDVSVQSIIENFLEMTTDEQDRLCTPKTAQKQAA